MIISFSIPEMRPMIEAGIRQANGEHVTERVKRQTIRRMNSNSRYMGMLFHPTQYTLQLWWKARHPSGYELGEVRCTGTEPITIRAEGDTVVVIVCHDFRATDYGLYKLATADGFDTLKDFADFFVPNPGDVFNGVLIKW